MVIMSYSYQKQIERLLDFIQEVQANCVMSCRLYAKAEQLLNDEPVRLTTYGLLETPRERKAPERI